MQTQEKLYFLVDVSDPGNKLFSSPFYQVSDKNSEIHLQMIQDQSWSLKVPSTTTQHLLYSYSPLLDKSRIEHKYDIIEQFDIHADLFQLVAIFQLVPEMFETQENTVSITFDNATITYNICRLGDYPIIDLPDLLIKY